MSLNLNIVIVAGRLCAAPELKTTNSGTEVCRFTVATDRPKEKDATEKTADFIDCVSFGKTAEFVSQYFSKGMPICVQGRLNTSLYEKDGKKYRSWSVLAERVSFVESKSITSTAQARASLEASTGVTAYSPQQYTEATDEDLPF